MGQADIIKVLQKKMGWLSSKQLSKKTGSGQGAVSCCCRKLLKRGEIKKRVIFTPYQVFLYKINGN